jgi:hypothetical protein
VICFSSHAPVGFEHLILLDLFVESGWPNQYTGDWETDWTYEVQQSISVRGKNSVFQNVRLAPTPTLVSFRWSKAHEAQS